MPGFLLVTLYAPLGAYGDIAVGERRAGFDRPGRSAILGLVAAALGIERHDEEAHHALSRSYAIALRVERSGSLLQDYQTVQAPPARRGKSWRTRREALAKPDPETLLSLRDYRTDPLVTAALVVRNAGAAATPDRLAAALTAPGFILYLGRKACPLGLPPRSLSVDSPSLAAALAEFDRTRPEPEVAIRRRLRVEPRAARYYADRDFADRSLLAPDFRIQRVETRRDEPASRRRWQFDLREELVIVPADGAERVQ